MRRACSEASFGLYRPCSSDRSLQNGHPFPPLILAEVDIRQMWLGSLPQIHSGVKLSLPNGLVFQGLTGLLGLHSAASSGYFHAREPITFPHSGQRLFILSCRSLTVASHSWPHATPSHRAFAPISHVLRGIALSVLGVEPFCGELRVGHGKAISIFKRLCRQTTANHASVG